MNAERKEAYDERLRERWPAFREKLVEDFEDRLDRATTRAQISSRIERFLVEVSNGENVYQYDFKNWGKATTSIKIKRFNDDEGVSTAVIKDVLFEEEEGE